MTGQIRRTLRLRRAVEVRFVSKIFIFNTVNGICVSAGNRLLLILHNDLIYYEVFNSESSAITTMRARDRDVDTLLLSYGREVYQYSPNF